MWFRQANRYKGGLWRTSCITSDWSTRGSAMWPVVLGGVAKEHRTDSLSAALRNLDRDVREGLTRRYEGLLADYGMEASCNNRGRAHENRSVEGPHGHLKRAIGDALLLRGSRDFEVLDTYRAFVAQVASRRNTRTAGSASTRSGRCRGRWRSGAPTTSRRPWCG